MPPNSPVKWAQCEDDLEAFTLDFDATHAWPNPPIKAQDVNLNMIGILSEAIEIDHINVHVDWDEAPVYEEVREFNGVFEDLLEYSTAWNVPSYAMEGTYVATFRGMTPDDDVAFCV